MSWNAKRYRKELYKPPLSKHHIPPQHPDKEVKVVKKISTKHHRAYHTLFGAAPTLGDCVEILERYWWPAMGDNSASHPAR